MSAEGGAYNRIAVKSTQWILNAKRAYSPQSTLEMRRVSQSSNTYRGYDSIQIADGKSTVVFTQQKCQIDEDGNLLNEAKKKAQPKRKTLVGKGDRTETSLTIHKQTVLFKKKI
jgi:hypothetical protein